jgi:hypothetical protein
VGLVEIAAGAISPEIAEIPRMQIMAARVPVLTEAGSSFGFQEMTVNRKEGDGEDRLQDGRAAAHWDGNISADSG